MIGCPIGPQCVECATGRIFCLECSPIKHFKALSGHIQCHVMSLNDYKTKYTQDGTGNDVPVGWTVKSALPGAVRPPSSVAAQQAANTQINSSVQTNDPISRTKNNLTDPERVLFDSRYKTLFLQADEDPALEAAVRDLVMNEISIARYQEQQNRITMGFAKGKITPQDAQSLTALAKLIRETQDTNLKLMASLAITRDAKQKAKKVVESTPSRYVAAYERIQKNFSPEQARRAENEEKEAIARLGRNVEALLPLAVVQTGNEV